MSASVRAMQHIRTFADSGCDAQGLSVYSKNLIQQGDPKIGISFKIRKKYAKNITAIIQRPNKIINHNQLQCDCLPTKHTNTEHTGRHLTKSIHLDEHPRRPWWS